MTGEGEEEESQKISDNRWSWRRPKGIESVSQNNDVGDTWRTASAAVVPTASLRDASSRPAFELEVCAMRYYPLRFVNRESERVQLSTK